MMTKENVRRAIEGLPENSTVADALDRLQVLAHADAVLEDTGQARPLRYFERLEQGHAALTELVTEIQSFVFDARYRMVVFMICLTLVFASAMVWSPAPTVRLPGFTWGLSGVPCVFSAFALVILGRYSLITNRPVLQFMQVFAATIIDAGLLAMSFAILCAGLGYSGNENGFEAPFLLFNIPCFGSVFLIGASAFFGKRDPQ